MSKKCNTNMRSTCELLSIIFVLPVGCFLDGAHRVQIEQIFLPTHMYMSGSFSDDRIR